MENQRITYKTESGDFKLIEAAVKMNKQELINYIGQLERKVYPELEFEKGQKVYHVEQVNLGSRSNSYVVREDKISRVSQLLDGTPRYRLSRARYTVGGDYLFADQAEANKEAAKLTELKEYKNTIYDAYHDCTIVPQTEFKDNDYRLAYEDAIKYLTGRGWKVLLYETFDDSVSFCLKKIEEYGDKIIDNEEGTNKHRIRGLVCSINRLISKVEDYNIEAKKYNHFVEVFKPEGIEKVPAKLAVDKVLIDYVAKFKDFGWNV